MARVDGDIVDGEHFFNIVANAIAYKARHDVGWPRVTHGRAELMARFRGYGDMLTTSGYRRRQTDRQQGG